MLTIDAQVHCYERNHPGRPWTAVLAGPPEVTGPDMIKAMDAVGVDGAILHPPSWDNGSNEMAIDAAVKYPGKFCIMGWFPLNDPSQRPRIDTWLQRPGMVGLRWALTRPEPVP